MKSLFQMPVGREKRDRAIKETMQRFPGQFRTSSIASEYLFRIILPPSRRWAYKPVAKCGSSSLLKLLFEIEFETKFTVKITNEDDNINDAHQSHVIANSRVFGRALEYGYSLHDVRLDARFGERIVLVRDPYSRLVSAWEYICLSHAKRSRRFEFDRLRLSAVCGFDWDKHPHTVYGLRLFLDYVQAEMAAVGTDNVNEHWRPQYDAIKPEAFGPSIVGKLEKLQEFLSEMSRKLECNAGIELPRENFGPESDRMKYDVKEIRNGCETVYKNDYNYFEY